MVLSGGKKNNFLIMTDEEIIKTAITKLPEIHKWNHVRIRIIFPNENYVVSILQTVFTKIDPQKGYHEVEFIKGHDKDHNLVWELVGIVK